MKTYVAVAISWLFASCNSLRPSFTSFKHSKSTLKMVTDENVGLVLSTSDIATGKFTYSSLGMPRVLPPGKPDEDWLLWLHARDDTLADDVVKLSTGRILFASSKDGLTNWKLHEDSPVLNPNKENDGDWFFFDSEHVGLGDVIQPGDKANEKFASQDGVFLMFTFGGCSDTVNSNGKEVKGVKMEIGVAVSQDGAHWSRLEGMEPYCSVLAPGKANEFDDQFIGWPSVVEIGSEYRMYYQTYNNKKEKFEIGLAVAPNDFMKWTKKGAVFDGGGEGEFDEGGAARRHILVMPNKTYRMWYEGISKKGVHSIGVATSVDGVQWFRLSNEPVFTANSDLSAWDSGGVGSPHMIYLPDKKRWRMYYIGTSDTEGVSKSCIGVAESLDEEGNVFERVKLN